MTTNFQAGPAPSSPSLGSPELYLRPSRNESPHLSNFLLHLSHISRSRLCVTTWRACGPSGDQGILLGMPA